MFSVPLLRLPVWHHPPSPVFNTKYSLILQHTEGWGVRQVRSIVVYSLYSWATLSLKSSHWQMPPEQPVVRAKQPVLVYLHIASLLCHCQRPQLWMKWQTETLDSLESMHKHLSAVSASLPHQPCPCCTSTESHKVRKTGTKAHC